MNYSDVEEARVQHLQMIQAVIARLGNNGFLMKGWAVTLAAAALGFAVSSNRWLLALIAIVPTVAFWALDAYFLRCERLFRELHKRVASRDAATLPFFMGATTDKFVDSLEGTFCNYWGGFRSGSLGFFYGSLIAVAVVVGIVVGLAGQVNTPG